MADPIIRDLGERLPTPQEKALIEFVDKAELASLDTLEAGARQIITLVTALFGVILGVLAVGKDSFAAALHTPLVTFLGSLAIGGLLVALSAALAVVIPGEHWLRGASLDDEKEWFAGLRQRKAGRLSAAVVAFGIGVVAFAVATLILLWQR